MPPPSDKDIQAALEALRGVGPTGRQFMGSGEVAPALGPRRSMIRIPRPSGTPTMESGGPDIGPSILEPGGVKASVERLLGIDEAAFAGYAGVAPTIGPGGFRTLLAGIKALLKGRKIKEAKALVDAAKKAARGPGQTGTAKEAEKLVKAAVKKAPKKAPKRGKAPREAPKPEPAQAAALEKQTAALKEVGSSAGKEALKLGKYAGAGLLGYAAYKSAPVEARKKWGFGALRDVIEEAATDKPVPTKTPEEIQQTRFRAAQKQEAKESATLEDAIKRTLLMEEEFKGMGASESRRLELMGMQPPERLVPQHGPSGRNSPISKATQLKRLVPEMPGDRIARAVTSNVGGILGVLMPMSREDEEDNAVWRAAYQEMVSGGVPGLLTEEIQEIQGIGRIEEAVA